MTSEAQVLSLPRSFSQPPTRCSAAISRKPRESHPRGESRRRSYSSSGENAAAVSSSGLLRRASTRLPVSTLVLPVIGTRSGLAGRKRRPRGPRRGTHRFLMFNRQRRSLASYRRIVCTVKGSLGGARATAAPSSDLHRNEALPAFIPESAIAFSIISALSNGRTDERGATRRRAVLHYRK